MRDLPAFLKAAYILLPVVAWLPSLPVLFTVLYEVESRSPVAAIL